MLRKKAPEAKETARTRPEKQAVSRKRATARSPRVSKGAVSDKALPIDHPTRDARVGTPASRASDTASAFSPTLGDIDLHLFGEGKHLRIYDKLGAHVMTH